MTFERLPLAVPLSIHALISFHYFEYAKGYSFEGEQHDFWEFLYVDKGEVEVRADERTLSLTQGMIVFHKPDEFHTVRVRQEHKPPNLIVIAFECASPPMSHLEDKVLALGDEERSLLSLIVKTGFQSFRPPYHHPSVHRLRRSEEAPFASEQELKAYLEILLLRLIRQQMEPDREARRVKPSAMHREKAERRVVQQLIALFRSRLDATLSLEDLCKEVHLGKSRLKEIFQAQTGMGALDYFKQLKIEEAKTLIREEPYNFTEIAARLGYASLHYFSRHFKKSVGMSPSEYARSVRARAQSAAIARPESPGR